MQLKKDFEATWGGNWTIFDHLLLDKILEEKHVSLELLENIGTRSTLLDSLISSLNPRWKTDQDLYQIMMETIHSVSQGGHCIFVGRGAAVVTQDLENAYHFRLEAPMEFRINSMVRRSEMNVKDVEAMVHQRQHQRESFIGNFLGRDLTDMALYHLKFNNQKVKVKDMSTTIKHFIEQHLE